MTRTDSPTTTTTGADGIRRAARYVGKLPAFGDEIAAAFLCRNCGHTLELVSPDPCLSCGHVGAPILPGEIMCLESFAGAIGDCIRAIGHDGAHRGAHGESWTELEPRSACTVGHVVADGHEMTATTRDGRPCCKWCGVVPGGRNSYRTREQLEDTTEYIGSVGPDEMRAGDYVQSVYGWTRIHRVEGSYIEWANGGSESGYTYGRNVRRPIPAGVTRSAAPALPRGYVLRCGWCGCSVDVDHVPNGEDCRLLQDERRHKYSS